MLNMFSMMLMNVSRRYIMAVLNDTLLKQTGVGQGHRTGIQNVTP
jgi:hypothetical protein